jgi:glycosyltransferase involved in cell wall biosynthesis
MPKVSICIPTYNQVEYLTKTLNSILIQGYQDYEIIISDDSNDDCVKRLLDTYDFQNKLKYYKNITSLGSPENWNKAVMYASGEYIKIMHHDDFFTYSCSLLKYVEILDSNRNIDFAFSAAIAINISENLHWKHSATFQQLDILKKNPNFLFFGNFIGPPSATIFRNKKELFFDKKLKWIVDFDFYIQCLLKNKNYGFSDEPLITSISGALHNVTNSCINNKEVEIYEYLFVLKKIKFESLIIDKRYIFFFYNLFSKYDIKSIKEIRKAGFLGTIPLFIRIIIFIKMVCHVLKVK